MHSFVPAMAHKHVLFNSSAREKVLRGATALANAVRVTLGPRSKCVLIEKKWGTPLVCDDGVTIAKEFDATKAAVAEGIVPGAGLALLRAIDAVEKEEAQAEGDERTGVRILKHALEVPSRQIAENSGLDGGVVVDRMRTSTGNHGFDAARGKYVDLVEAGIIDATKVIRIALENAVSVAGVLLLTEATLTEVPEAKPEHAPALE